MQTPNNTLAPKISPVIRHDRCGQISLGVAARAERLLGAAAVGGALADSEAILAIPVAIIAGVVLGGAWGFIPGFLKAATGAHEVVTTIMLNFIAATIIGALVVGPLLGPGVASETAEVRNAALPVVFGRNLHLGVVIAFAGSAVCDSSIR
jgi:simple sugar transport system permease protein